MYETHFQTVFDAGHMVVDAHRHRFRVRVRCAGEPCAHGPTKGMVVDFGALSEVLDAAVRSELEGFMLVDEDDDTGGLEHAGMPVKALPFRPTVENLARWCFDQVTAKLSESDAGKVDAVEVWENERCMAAYRR